MPSPPAAATEPRHPAARRVAEHACEVLGRRRPGALGAPGVHDPGFVAAVVDVAFWASLRREEGASPRVSLAVLPPGRAGDPLVFRRRLPLSAAALARLAPAVKRPGIHLGVAPARAGVCIWGATRELPPFTLVLEVIEPGVLVLKYPPLDGGKFVNLVVLEGDRDWVLDHIPEHLPDCPTPLAQQLGLGGPARPWHAMAELLVELAVSMRQHGHGGTLLVVPDEGDGWRASVVRTNPYEVSPAYAMRGTVTALPPDGDAGVAPGVVDAIAGLTAVDGATVLSTSRHVLAFGTKIVRRPGRPQVRRVLLSVPVVDDAPTLVPIGQLGGTRHLSAAQFVADQPESLALVASQDGRFTVFSWAERTAAWQPGAWRCCSSRREADRRVTRRYGFRGTASAVWLPRYGFRTGRVPAADRGRARCTHRRGGRPAHLASAMGALLVYFAVGSIVAVPILGYHLLRTRRELSELRAELQRRGLIGPGAGVPAPEPDPSARARLAGPAPAPLPAARAEPPRDQPADGAEPRTRHTA
jgi:hypothetical protein